MRAYLRRMLQQKFRSGAGYAVVGDSALIQLTLTLERDITVGRFAERIRLLVEDCDEAVAQVLPLIVATPK